MEALIELLREDSEARTYVEVACLYLGRHLITGAFDLDYSIAKIAELGSGVVPVLEALEARWRETGAIE